MTLEELKTRPATPEELQDMLIKFIELYNSFVLATRKELDNKQDKPWRATI